MKSEIENNDKPLAADPQEEEKTGEEEEKRREPEEKTEEPEEEKTGGETEPSGGGIITYAALLLLAVGAGWFLFGLVRRRRAAPVDLGYDEVEQYQRIPAFPGF